MSALVIWLVGIHALGLISSLRKYVLGIRPGIIGTGTVLLGLLFQSITVGLVIAAGPVGLAGGFLIVYALANALLLIYKRGERATKMNSAGEFVFLVIFTVLVTIPAFFV